MATEVIGPPAAGKTTFLRALSPAMVAINEPLYELNAAGFLPSSGIVRQKAVIDHALAQSAQAGDRAVIDSGVIYLLAFSQLRFRLDPALTGLFEETAATAQAADIRFSGILRLNAPVKVLEQRMLADASRKRGHFEQNVLLFRSISRMIDELIQELGQNFLFSVDNTEDSEQMDRAHDWTKNRSSNVPLRDVVCMARTVWTSSAGSNSVP